MIITEQGIKYEINEKDLTAKIVHLTSEIGDNVESITIPKQFINIDEKAFYQSKNIKSIKIDQITEIQTKLNDIQRPEIWSSLPKKYNIQSILNISFIDKELIHSIYSQFQFKYHSFDDNSDNQNFISELFSYLMNFKLIIYYFVNSNCIICVEGKCLFIDKIEKEYIEHIINLLKIQQISLINLTEESKLITDANNEIDGFCTNFKKIIDDNDFIKNTIRPIVGYMIRRFYYPSSHFKDPSFFNFDQKMGKEAENKKKIILIKL